MIARRGLWVIGNSVLGALFGYVALFAMARYMGDELVGARAYVLSIVFLLAVVTRLGFPTTHARRLGRGDDLAIANGTYLALKMALTATFVVLAAVTMWVWFFLLQKPAIDVTERALWLGIAVVVAKSIRDVATNTFRGLERIPERESILFTNTVVTVALTALVGLAQAHATGRWTPVPWLSSAAASLLNVTEPMTHATGLNWLMAAFLAGEMIALGLAVALWTRARLPIGRPDPAVAREYFHATLPIMLVTIAGVLMRRMDQVMIGFWHDASALGQYAGATKLTELVLILSSGLRIVLLPLIARLDAEGRQDVLARTLIEVERWISMLIWPAALLVWIIPQAVLHVALSDAFLPAAGIMMVLMIHSILTSLTDPLRSKALGTGKHATAAKVAGAALAVNLVLNVILIPRWAGMGAAVATVAAGLVMFFAYRQRANAWIGHPYVSRHVMNHMAAAAVAGVVSWSLMPDMGAARFYHVLAAFAGITVVYALVLLVLKELHMGDWANLRRMISGRSPQKSEDNP